MRRSFPNRLVASRPVVDYSSPSFVSFFSFIFFLGGISTRLDVLDIFFFTYLLTRISLRYWILPGFCAYLLLHLHGGDLNLK